MWKRGMAIYRAIPSKVRIRITSVTTEKNGERVSSAKFVGF